MKRTLVTLLILQLGTSLYAQQDTYPNEEIQETRGSRFLNRIKKRIQRKKRKKVQVELADAYKDDYGSTDTNTTSNNASSSTYSQEVQVVRKTQPTTYSVPVAETKYETSTTTVTKPVASTTYQTTTVKETYPTVKATPVVEKPVKTYKTTQTHTTTHSRIAQKVQEAKLAEQKGIIENNKTIPRKKIVEKKPKKEVQKEVKKIKTKVAQKKTATELAQKVAQQKKETLNKEKIKKALEASKAKQQATKQATKQAQEVAQKVVKESDVESQVPVKKVKTASSTPTVKERITTYDVDQVTIDYGEIEKGSNGLRQFKLTNTGKYPLIIGHVYSTCGCTVPKKPENAIMPGESGTIDIVYDTKRIGPFHKTVNVYSNAQETIKALHIKGVVLAPSI